MPLTKKQLTELKELLLQEKANLMGIKWNPETDAGFGGDLVDQSTGLTEQELRLELAEHDRERRLEHRVAVVGEGREHADGDDQQVPAFGEHFVAAENPFGAWPSTSRASRIRPTR